MHNKIFRFSERTIIRDDLDEFIEILEKSSEISYGIFFDFKNPHESLRKVKKIIQARKESISFENLYFFNAHDFINTLLDTPIYLPKNINLFINESCFIGCNYCHNKNHIHEKISLEKIQNFLENYHLSDTMNFNIIGQGDPLFHPELLEILEYIKSFGGHTTFFSWGKSLLYCHDTKKLNSLVDEFKINLSASNATVYNAMHSFHITSDEFQKLTEILKSFWDKVTLITVLMKWNITDIVPFYKLARLIGAFALEIKQDVFYPKNSIFENKEIVLQIEKTIQKLIDLNDISILTNFSISSLFEPKPFHTQSVSLVEKLIVDGWIPEIPEDLSVCHQFGNSVDITERWVVSVCCKYDIWSISTIDYTDSCYKNGEFQRKYKEYSNRTPDACKTCPMPIDRYKNTLKHLFIKEL
jgi:wyosine [tRNA(Phe)-imidazoG37] synthetase (radical SAM superfamily)